MEKTEYEEFDDMIDYALQARTVNEAKSMIWDILHGCTGADNLKSIRSKYGTWEEHLNITETEVPH